MFYYIKMENHIVIYFFFQAEDGIRDRNVTGVQTCALPISSPRSSSWCASVDPMNPAAPVTRTFIFYSGSQIGNRPLCFSLMTRAHPIARLPRGTPAG